MFLESLPAAAGVFVVVAVVESVIPFLWGSRLVVYDPAEERHV
jgi:hypothetical protein